MIKINRRNFLSAAGAFVVPYTVHGVGMKAYSQSSALVQSLMQSNVAFSDRILVMINLIGGNDGLNTVIPLDQYSAYDSLRHNVAIPQSSVLQLAGTGGATGLHPAMTGMRNLYNDGKLGIIHSVSYPNPNQSHFRSADIWMTGVSAEQYDPTGWVGRYLENRYPGFPTGYPNTTMEDPIALQIGYLGTPTLQGTTQNLGITIDSPENFYNLIGSAGTTPPVNLPPFTQGEQIQYIRLQQALAVEYAAEIKAAADAGTNMATYPAAIEKNELANQLKIVARLIHGGLKTKVFFVTQYGYDTHSTQVDATDTRTGVHANLMKHLSDAIAAFQADIQLMGKADNVMGMTFSEFGRRANSNSSRGTDHGVAAPMFMFGNSLKKQQIGTNPNLTTGLLPVNPQPWETHRDIKMQIDFRRVYNDILTDWFGVPQATTGQLLFQNFPTTSLFRDGVETIEDGTWTDPCVWSAGRPPLPNEKVLINNGQQINISQTTTTGSLTNNGNITLHNGANLVVSN
jgi:uncharacterized protein (DUF1501 family)